MWITEHAALRLSKGSNFLKHMEELVWMEFAFFS